MSQSSPLFALRMDDVGASTKWFNWHGVEGRKWGHWFLNKAAPFGRWGPYRELRHDDWSDIADILDATGSRLTVGVTATWVTWNGELIPFPTRFPDEARILKDLCQDGLVEIACHGLTHCVLKGHAFRPRWNAPNRWAHREFHDFIGASEHRDHLERATNILATFFSRDIKTFIPPGNLWTPATEFAALSCGYRYLASLESVAPTGHATSGLVYVGTGVSEACHDRDIRCHGAEYLEQLIGRMPFRRSVTIAEMGALIASRENPGSS